MSFITISPVCVSCQSSIGHIYPLYFKLHNKRLVAYIDKTGYKVTDPSTIPSINMKDFLDKVTPQFQLCCRQSILGHNQVVQDSI